jgi:hypothetical protein
MKGRSRTPAVAAAGGMHAAVEPLPSAGGDDRAAVDRIHPAGAVAGVLATVFFCWHAWAVLRGYFWQDDFRYIYGAVTQPLGSYVFQDYDGNLMPGQFLLVWLLTHLAPMHYTLAVLPVLALQAFGYVLMWRLLIRLFGHRWALLVPYAVVVAAPMIFTATLWWAFALQLMPLQVAMLGALNAHVGYLQMGNRRQAVQALAWIAGGLFCWEKALLIIPLVFGVAVVLSPGAALLDRVLGAVRRHRRLWTWYGVLATGYVVLYLTRTAEVGQAPLQAGDLARLAKRMIADTLLPGVLGGPWAVHFEAGLGLAVPPAAVLVVSWLVAVAILVGGLVVGGRRAVLAWLLLAGYLACSVLLVAVSRLGVFGTVVGGVIRFSADAVPVAALCGALAFMRPLAPRVHAPASHSAQLRPAGVGVLAGCALLVIGACVSIAQMAPGGEHRQARQYVETARAAFVHDPNLVLVDEPVPDDVMIWLLDAYRRTSQVFAALPRRPRFDQPTDNLRILDTDGVPRPVGLLDTVAAPPGPVFNCGYWIHDSWVSVPLVRPANSGHRVIRISYYTATPATGTVRVADARFAVQFTTGAHYLFVVADGPVYKVEIGGDPGTGVCVVGLVVGAPVPAAS